MDQPSADNVATLTKKVSAYSSQLAVVFHSHALSAEKIPRGFEGAINVLDATVVTLNQVLSLLASEAEGIKDGINKRNFSQEGLEYVELLATECATTLAKVEPIIADACLNAKELKVKRRREKRELAKNGPAKVDIAALNLDEKTFLGIVENAKWSQTTVEIEGCMERLYNLQLHLLLVFQVVTVGVMSTDVSSGKVDVKSIIAFHDRIYRTAELVGIEPPKGRSRYKRSVSSSGSDILFDSDSSDSDSSSIQSFKRTDRTDKAETKETCATGPPVSQMRVRPPPPPPAKWPHNIPCLSPQWSVPSMVVPPLPPSPPTETLAGITVNSLNPPSYSESKPVAPASISVTSTLLGTVSQISNIPTSASEKSSVSQSSDYPAEKEEPKETPATKDDKEDVITAKVSRKGADGTTYGGGETAPVALEPRLFKSNTNGLRFKFKSLFRSNKSLADEMKKVLGDANSALLAVVIHAGNLRQVPHSAFHSLEATHMRTIISQINSQEWYDTFTKMDSVEHATLSSLLRPYWVKGERYERELVVLKVVHERKHAWAVVLRDILSKIPVLHTNNSRVLLAIVREKLFDGKPWPVYTALPLAPPPPPRPPMTCSLFPPSTVVPTVRPPPGLPSPPIRSTKTSDLRVPPMPQPPLGAVIPAYGNTAPSLGKHDIPLGPGIESIRISDTTPLTDYDATLALTTYVEYTLRVTDSLNPTLARSWSRVTVTQESAERQLIIQRIQTFQRAGGNVLEVSLRLTEQQSNQVTRLLDELKAGERDARFEWCWVELSLYNGLGEITDFASNGGFPKVAAATMMHLIAKRMPKAHCKPVDLYSSLMRPPPPPVPVVNQAPIQIFEVPPRPRSRSRSRRRRDDFYSTDSSFRSSISSGDSSVGYVRRELRKNKVRKMEKARWRGSDYSSDSEDESNDEDVIKINLKLKRGDDVVQSLLNLWTPQIEGKGKGKEKAKVRKTAFGMIG